MPPRVPHRTPAAASPPAPADVLRERICSVAASLFIERGFGSTTMQDIADALGISRPKLYYYFRDKGAILDAAVRNVPMEAERRARAAIEASRDDPEAALRAMVTAHTRLILERPVEFRLLDMSMDHVTSALRARANRAKRGLLDAFTEVVRAGVARGVFRVVDPRVASFAMIGMANWTAAWFRPDGRVPADAVAEQIADLAVQSVRGPKEAARGVDAHGPRESLRLLREGVAHLELMLGAAAPVNGRGATKR